MIVLTPSVGHEELLVLVELHRLGLIRHYYNDVWRRRKVTVDEHEWLAQQFEENRPHLRAVAYRMLGSPSEAEDAVQEAWLEIDLVADPARLRQFDLAILDD